MLVVIIVIIVLVYMIYRQRRKFSRKMNYMKNMLIRTIDEQHHKSKHSEFTSESDDSYEKIKHYKLRRKSQRCRQSDSESDSEHEMKAKIAHLEKSNCKLKSLINTERSRAEIEENTINALVTSRLPVDGRVRFREWIADSPRSTIFSTYVCKPDITPIPDFDSLSFDTDGKVIAPFGSPWKQVTKISSHL